MNGRRHTTRFACIAYSALLGLAVQPALARDDNFERTVGSDLAGIALTAMELREAVRNAGSHGSTKRASACELCASGSRGVLPMPYENGRLDQRLRSRYRQLGESLAARLWDDPKGRRVKFDIEGKPGLGLVIPFD